MTQPPSREPADGITRTERIAAGLAIGWMVTVGLFFWLLPPARQAGEGFDSLRFVLMLIAIFMPVAMIWVAVAAARSARIMREESFRVQSAVDGMRQTYLAERAAKAPAVEKKLDEIAASTRKTETAMSGFASRREVSRIIEPRPAPQPADQHKLPLGTPAEDLDPPLMRPDLIRALNFPENEHDTDGFAALRRALRDRNARKLVQASQDVLTLLSQDGIYMDDLHPEPAGAALWRRFAQGERGQAVAPLGGIRDRAALALTSGRMREDAIFRDTVHHFLRKFDQMLVTFEDSATDADMLELADTRTARAFMLLGRATGTFD